MLCFFVCFFQEQTQKCGDIILHSFDPVVVRLSLDSNNVQREKFVLQLVKPYVPNFSVLSLNQEEDKVDGQSLTTNGDSNLKSDKNKSNKKGNKSKKSK